MGNKLEILHAIQVPAAQVAGTVEVATAPAKETEVIRKKELDELKASLSSVMTYRGSVPVLNENTAFDLDAKAGDVILISGFMEQITNIDGVPSAPSGTWDFGKNSQIITKDAADWLNCYLRPTVSTKGIWEIHNPDGLEYGDEAFMPESGEIIGMPLKFTDNYGTQYTRIDFMYRYEMWSGSGAYIYYTKASGERIPVYQHTNDICVWLGDYSTIHIDEDQILPEIFKANTTQQSTTIPAGSKFVPYGWSGWGEALPQNFSLQTPGLEIELSDAPNNFILPVSEMLFQDCSDVMFYVSGPDQWISLKDQSQVVSFTFTQDLEVSYDVVEVLSYYCIRPSVVQMDNKYAIQGTYCINECAKEIFEGQTLGNETYPRIYVNFQYNDNSYIGIEFKGSPTTLYFVTPEGKENIGKEFVYTAEHEWEELGHERAEWNQYIDYVSDLSNTLKINNNNIIQQGINPSTDAKNEGNNISSGKNNAIFGDSNTNQGDSSVIAGSCNTAGLNSSFSSMVGTWNTLAEDSYNSIIGGHDNTNKARNSIVSGENNTNLGRRSIIAGESNSTHANTVNSVVLGRNNAVTGRDMLVIGDHNEIGLDGTGTVSMEGCALVGGRNNIVNGAAGLTIGGTNKNKNTYSNTLGYGLITSTDCQTVVGLLNKKNTDALFIVGSGYVGADNENDSGRRNSLEVANLEVRVGDHAKLIANEATINYITSGIVKATNTIQAPQALFGTTNRSTTTNSLQVGTDNAINSAGQGSLAIGYRNGSGAPNSLVAGTENVTGTGSKNAALLGNGLISVHQNQLVVGQYNEAVDAAFVIGMGSDGDHRKNSLIVSKTGDVHIKGVIYQNDQVLGIYTSTPDLPPTTSKTSIPMTIRVKVYDDERGYKSHYEYYNRTYDFSKDDYFEEGFLINKVTGETGYISIEYRWYDTNYGTRYELKSFSNSAEGQITFLVDDSTLLGTGRLLAETTPNFEVYQNKQYQGGAQIYPAIRLGNTILYEFQLKQLLALLDNTAVQTVTWEEDEEDQ